MVESLPATEGLLSGGVVISRSGRGAMSGIMGRVDTLKLFVSARRIRVGILRPPLRTGSSTMLRMTFTLTVARSRLWAFGCHLCGAWFQRPYLVDGLDYQQQRQRPMPLHSSLCASGRTKASAPTYSRVEKSWTDGTFSRALRMTFTSGRNSGYRRMECILRSTFRERKTGRVGHVGQIPATNITLCGAPSRHGGLTERRKQI